MIYLDHAAATPVSKVALAAMSPYFSDQFFNPSAPYLPAKHVRTEYQSAKSSIARAIGAKATDLVITAGATESINLAFTACRTTPCDDHAAPRILTLPTEHAAVLAAAKAYGTDFIAVDRTGLIDLADLRAKLTDEITLVSISLANNELGTIQPLAEIATILHTVRQDRLRRGIDTPLYLHSDASQALNLLDINVARIGVDLLTLNAAKCGGPKGVGALYLAHGVPVRPLSLGGGQERGLRSGTENVPGVIGFAAALAEVKQHINSNRKKYTAMTDLLKKELTKYPTCLFLGNPKHQLANFLPISFPGIDAERLIYHLEQQEIYLSTGAACAANHGTKSHVLTAIGLAEDEIAGSLRISLGSTNTLDQMPIAAQALIAAVRAESERQHRV